MTSTFGTAVMAAAGGGSGSAQTPAAAAPEFYVWRQYILKTGTQPRRLAEFLQAAIPALNRLGHSPIGVFDVLFGVPSPSVFVLTPAASADALMAMEGRLEQDGEFMKGAAAYFDAAADMNFLDTDAAVIGPPVRQAERIFDAYWNSPTAIPLAALVQADPEALDQLRASIDAGLQSDRAGPYARRLQRAQGVRDLVEGRRRLHWTSDASVISDPPEKAQGARPGPDWMTPVLVERASRVKRELKVISPYFVPGEAGVRWIDGLRRRGVDVSILTNSLAATDVLAVHGGYAGYRVPLLRSGVSLFELKPHGASGVRSSLFGSSGASLHTKAFVVDGAHGFIGSFNLDPRSMNLNTEMGLLFDCPGAAAELEALYRSKASPQASYRLGLADGTLRWYDDAARPPSTWDREPEAGLWSRAMARVIGWLPVESQL